MKKHVLFSAYVLLAFAIAITSRSQSPKDIKEVSEKSKIETFALKTGSLIKREFTTLGSAKQVEVKKLVISDISTKTYITGVKLETYVTQTYGGSTKACFLDSDEIEAFVQSAKYLLELTPSDSGNYIELQFTSRGGFQAGAYLDKKDKWKYYLKLERYDSDSYVFLEKADFEKLQILLAAFK